MSSIGILEERLQTILNQTKHHFHRDLYPWQIIAIKNILIHQRDTIVIAGTGSGKSLIFQSLQFATPDAIVLVVSPLIALMENQANFPIDSS
jgi:superfamily II DNA helicase RecQ